MFFDLKWPFVGQPDNFIGWATSLAYTWGSQGPFPEILGEKIFRNDGFEKLNFLKQHNSNIQNSKKLQFSCLIPVKMSHKFLGSMEWIQFLWLLWFPSKD